MKVYLSAALFSRAEQDFNRRMGKVLSEAGHEVVLPQELDHLGDQDRIFELNVRAVDESDLVLAIVDGTDVDSGVAWEMGYAFAKGIPVISLRTDFRRLSETKEGAVNLMLHRGSAVYLEESREPFEAAVRAAADLSREA